MNVQSLINSPESKFDTLPIKYPYIHPTNYKRLAKLVELSENSVEKILSINNKADTTIYEIIENPIYLSYDITTNIVEFTPIFNKSICNDIVITGNYSLYISLFVFNREYNLDGKINAPVIAEMFSLVSFNVLVLPKSVQASNDFVTRLADHYVILDNLNQKYNQVDAKFHEDIISEFEINQLAEVPTLLLQHDLAASNYKYVIQHIYNDTISILSGKDGVIRGEYLGQRTDFSARCVVTIDLSLHTHQIKIPKITFTKLFILEYITWVRFNYDDPLHNSSYILHPDQCIYINEFIEWFFDNSSILDRLVSFGRQPTLWRFGLMSVEVLGISDTESDIGPIIMVSPLIVDPSNMDFDGDTAYINKFHTTKAKKNLYDTMFVGFHYQYDHNQEFLYNATLEAYYCFNVLSQVKSDPNEKSNWLNIEVDTFDDIPITYELIQEFNKYVVIRKFKDQNITYGLAVLHKLTKCSDISIKQNMSESDITKLIYDSIHPKTNINANNEYHIAVTNFNRHMHNFVACIGEFSLTLPIANTCQMLKSVKELSTRFELPNHANIGIHLHDALLNKASKTFTEDNVLSVIAQTKFKKDQLKRAILSIGFVSDSNNIIIDEPILNNMFCGLTEDQYFKSAYGSRLGLVSKESLTPKSGYLTRTMVMNNSPVEIFNKDCNTIHLFKINILTKIHFKSLVNRYYSVNKTCVSSELKLLTENDTRFIGKTIYFRSPIMCNSPYNKICRTCFGEHYIPSKYVGVFTSQTITERLTQLSLRIFHTSGSGIVTNYPKLTLFLETHLDRVSKDNENDRFTLSFKIPITVEIMEILTEIKCDIIEKSEYDITISNVHNVENDDIALRIKEIQGLLKTETIKTNINTPLYTYTKLITEILSIGDLYSVYVECVLCNLYYTTDDQLLRYAVNSGTKNVDVAKKYSIYNVHNAISPIIGFLYQPNKRNFLKYFIESSTKSYNKNEKSVFEKMWLYNHI